MKMLGTAALICVLLAGCEKSDATNETATAAAESAPTESAEPATEPESAAETSTSDNWLLVPEAELNQAQNAQLDRAKAAQKQLGGTLLKALTTSIGENGAAGSVTFCKQEAPRLAAEVAATKGVTIGRTSRKLRNPDNAGAPWVSNATTTAGESSAAFAGPNGELGYIAPIKTAALCTTCHGSPDDIPPDVATALNDAYPDDQARGFAEGDLRGWFWVAVPPPS